MMKSLGKIFIDLFYNVRNQKMITIVATYIVIECIINYDLYCRRSFDIFVIEM